MAGAFNVIGRIISTLLGVLLVLGGGVWILQAYNIAFNGPMGSGGRSSFMVNDHHWAVYGAIAVLIGLCQVAWSNTRKS
jgi:hypothetical protein